MPESVDKHWIGAEELLEDSLELARRVLESGYAPTLVIGLWRGGAPVAIALHEALRFCGLRVDHLPLRTALYTGIDQRAPTVRIDGLEALHEHAHADARMLLVDDVFDTGITMQQVLGTLEQFPGERRIAALWWKPTRNLTALRPDYCVHRSERWLVFPHELCGLDEAEISRHKPAACVATLLAMRALAAARRGSG
ncbi:MAG: hypoxanthine phosphoribosyltransferase [Gammaproteobacteria bacterium]|jgi:hypoxanthine phosphoribosyltransferase|nr:hypoxanthine phosphoribosyltransferase [Gammaproteobacteria bacterium]MBP6052126.1 hypothetical protein [Pseudomonadales bacterium]MBK6582187.1 hypoxanthine phosphoribosyltransferase [Gammaproteobacteria bacterium]MBK7170582.1 hypoxanthine phosphoribosyltransferase [Gammaproteobacteria bacterium]MBK7729313.1 hypoxanthine phosphoribosyltransferase [Gammaproteobacteria bacterium]